MNENGKRRANILDGGIVFLIAVTMLLATNLIFAFWIPQDALFSESYYIIVGIAELLAIGIPAFLYLLINKISIKTVFKGKISAEQGAISAFLAVFAYPVLALSRLLWAVLLNAIGIPEMAQPMSPMGSLPIFLIAIVSVSLIPGISEEVMMRGIIMDAHRRKHTAAKSILFSAVLFMLLHGDVYSWTYTFAAGLILGYLFYITGSLWTVIIYHAVNNFIGVAAGYIYSLIGYEEIINQGSTQLYGGIEMIIGIIGLSVISVFAAGVCVLLIWALKKVSKKPENIIVDTAREKKISYLPYFVGGFLMVLMAVLPVVVQMIRQ